MGDNEFELQNSAGLAEIFKIEFGIGSLAFGISGIEM